MKPLREITDGSLKPVEVLQVESNWDVFDSLEALREKVGLGKFVPCHPGEAFTGLAKKVLDKGRITSKPNYSFYMCTAEGNYSSRSIISYQAVSVEGKKRSLYFVTNDEWFSGDLNALYCHMVLYEDENGKVCVLNQFSPCDFLFDPLKDDSGFVSAYGMINGDIGQMDKKSYVAIVDPDKTRKYLNFIGMEFDIYDELGALVLHELGHAQYMRAVISSLNTREAEVYGTLLNAIHSAVSQFPTVNFSRDSSPKERIELVLKKTSAFLFARAMTPRIKEYLIQVYRIAFDYKIAFDEALAWGLTEQMYHEYMADEFANRDIEKLQGLGLSIDKTTPKNGYMLDVTRSQLAFLPRLIRLLRDLNPIEIQREVPPLADRGLYKMILQELN